MMSNWLKVNSSPGWGRLGGGGVYDPIIARFLSADPIGLEASSSAILNRYGYVNNNPLNATDPSGYYRRGNSSSWGVSGAGDGTGNYTNWDYLDRSWYHGSYMAGVDAAFELNGAIWSGNVRANNWNWYNNILFEQYGHAFVMPFGMGSFYSPEGEQKDSQEVEPEFSDEQVGEVLAYIDGLSSTNYGCSAPFDGGDPGDLQDGDETDVHKKPQLIFGISYDITFAFVAVGYTIEVMVLQNPETNEPVTFVSYGFTFGLEASTSVSIVIIYPVDNDFKFSQIEGTSASGGGSFGWIGANGSHNYHPNTHPSGKSKTYLQLKIGVGTGVGGSLSPALRTKQFDFFYTPRRHWWK